MRYSYASPNRSIELSSKLPSSRSPIASSSFTSFSLRLATVFPSFELFTSRSSNKPLRSSSLSAPTAEPSMFLNTRSRVSLRFSSRDARWRTLSNSSDGRM